MKRTECSILVFPCGSEIGLEICRSLMYSRHIKVFGGSSVDDHGKFVCGNYIGDLPFENEANFIDRLNEAVDKHKIDFIYPAHDNVVLRLADNSNSLHCKVIGSPAETARICRYKSKTYKKLQSVVKVPRMYEDISEIRKFPVFLKPDAGQGSKGTYIATNKEEVGIYLKKNKELLLLEYLPGREYTIDCFTNRNGELQFCAPRERKRVMNGITVNTRSMKQKREFHKIAQILNRELKFTGAWFYQLKRNDRDELVLLEIAPRIAGTMALYRNLGVNLALMSVWDALGINVSIIKNKFDIELDRALVSRFSLNIKYRHVYIDLDDCLIIRNKVNTQMMAFLFQCINQGIHLHLITKHKKDINMTLKKYRLSGIFDTVHHIDKTAFKPHSIKHKNAIFIDDSFAERKGVLETLNIPVFAPDAIESLLNFS